MATLADPDHGVPMRGAGRLLRRLIAVTLFVLTLATLVTHERYVLRADDPMWRHLAPFRWWLLPHVAGGLQTASGADASTVGEMATAAGDPVRIRVLASDNHQLAWIGWRLGAPANTADSVPVTGTQGVDNSVVAAGPAWVGTSPLTIFARDAAGNLAEVHPIVDRLMVYSSRAATIERAPLGRMVLYWAYDQPHDRLVVLLEDSTTIYTVPLGTFTPDAPVRLPEVAGGLDVTPNGDSFLVTLPQSAALGEWQIGSPIVVGPVKLTTKGQVERRTTRPPTA